MFGRKKTPDDDPFAALRDGGTYHSAPTTTVEGIPGSGIGETPVIAPISAPAPAVAEPTFAPAQPPVRATRTVRVRPVVRRSGRGGIVSTVIVLAIIAAIAIPIIATSSAVHSFSIHSFSVPSFTSSAPIATPAPGSATPSPPATPAPPKIDYMTATGLKTGLERIAKLVPGSKLSNVRVDHVSVDAFATLPNGRIKDVSVGNSGSFVSSGGNSGEHGFRISAIPTAAVARIVSAMQHRFHVPPARIDYLVLEWFGGLPPQWIAFSKAPSHPGYAATLSGAGLHPIGS